MLDKSIYYKKEYRNPYYHSKQFDRTCRPHGSCSYCRYNRFYSIITHIMNAEDTKELSDEDMRHIYRTIHVTKNSI